MNEILANVGVYLSKRKKELALIGTVGGLATISIAGVVESSDLKINQRRGDSNIEVMTRFGTGLRIVYPVGIFFMRESRCEEDKRYPGGFTRHKYERLTLRFSDEASVHTQNQQWTRRRPGSWAASYDNYCNIGPLEKLKPMRSEVRGTPSGR